MISQNGQWKTHMCIGNLKKILDDFDDSDLVVLSEGSDAVDWNHFHPMGRAEASKLVSDGGDVFCVVFFPTPYKV